MPDLAILEQRAFEAGTLISHHDSWAKRYAQDVPALLAELKALRAELDDLLRDRWAISCGSCG